MNEKELAEKFKGVIAWVFEAVDASAVVQVEPGTVDGKQYLPDLLVTARIGKREYRIAVEIKALGQPRVIRLAAQQLQEYLASNTDIKYGVLAAPYITDEGRALCRRSGIGCIDLAGNAWLALSGLYIDVQGMKNPYPATRGIKSLFNRKSSRAVRVLLSRPNRPWFVRELATEAEISLGQASNVKRLLTAEDLIQADGRAFRLAEPQRLLDAWAKYYSFQDNASFDYYAIQGTQAEREIGDLCNAMNVKYALSLFSGANLKAPFVRHNRAFIYVEDKITEIARQAGLKEVASGPNVTLLTPYDQGVFYGNEKINGLSVVSDIQLYLDLIKYPGRGAEAAGYILENKVKPTWR